MRIPNAQKNVVKIIFSSFFKKKTTEWLVYILEDETNSKQKEIIYIMVSTKYYE